MLCGLRRNFKEMLYFEVQTKKSSRPASIQTWGTRGRNHALIWALQFPLVLLSRVSSFKWFLLSTLAWLVLPGIGPVVKGAWWVIACKSQCPFISPVGFALPAWGFSDFLMETLARIETW